MVVYDVEVLKYLCYEDLPVVVPIGKALDILSWVHNYSLTGHYVPRPTMARLLPTYYWKGMSKNSAQSTTTFSNAHCHKTDR